MSVKPITDTLRLLEDGRFIDRSSTELADLVKAVDETGKAGTLTITLKLKKASGAVSIAADVKAKVPEPKSDDTLLWATVEGNLQLTNPNQRQLDLRAVTETKQPVRTVDQETGEIRTA
jgi:hypothetical protein